MNGDQLVERGAVLLEDLSQRARAHGGFVSKLAPDLADDAVFLRKLKPSLVAARIRGEPATNGRVRSDVPAPAPEAPPAPEPEAEPAPELERRPALKPKKPKTKGNGPNPFVIAGVALVAGIFVAKLVDWRGHAHPRD